MVRFLFVQKEMGEKQGNWMSTLQEYDIKIKTTKILILEVFTKCGVPKNIVSDRDSKFTSKVWTKVFNALGTRLNFSSGAFSGGVSKTPLINAKTLANSTFGGRK